MDNGKEDGGRERKKVEEKLLEREISILIPIYNAYIRKEVLYMHCIYF